MSIDNREYNGWTNYATWRVNLEIFDGMTARDLTCRHVNSPAEVAEAAEAYVDNILTSTSSDLALGYALAFIADVNWQEIADSLMIDLVEDEDINEDEDD